MASEHIEMVRRACECWNRGDISEYREMYTDDVTAFAGALWPEAGGHVVGPDAIIEAFESLIASFARSELIPQRFIEDGDTLVVPIVMRCVPHGSTVAVDQPIVLLYRFRENRIVHHAFYSSLDEALAAGGLEADVPNP